MFLAAEADGGGEDGNPSAGGNKSRKKLIGPAFPRSWCSMH
jgi:hypothetical protein